MATMFEIDKKTLEYSATHQVLKDRMMELEDEVAKIRRKFLPGIRRACANAAEMKAMLVRMIDDSREHFDAPRTRILHGVKIGLQKGKGKLTWEDDDLVVKLIKKHFPEETWEMLIKTSEKPRKDGLNGLDVRELRKLGVAAEETADQVVVKPTDSEIDKLVDALLKETEEPEAA